MYTWEKYTTLCLRCQLLQGRKFLNSYLLTHCLTATVERYNKIAFFVAAIVIVVLQLADV